MPKFYATVLRYDTQAKQADSIATRKLVLSDALTKANAFIESQMDVADQARQQVWGLFAAPEYTFANPLLHGDHGVGDVRHVDEGTKVDIEAWLQALSSKHPHTLMFPGSIAWKKPLARDMKTYVGNKKAVGIKLSDTQLKNKFDAKPATRVEKAAASIRQNANDFQGGDLTRQVAGDINEYEYRGYKLNPSATSAANAWLFETDDPSGKMDGGKCWTSDAAKAAIKVKSVLHTAPTSKQKLTQLKTVTHMARNTCLVYLGGRKVAKYHKAQDYHEVIDNGGNTVYVPGKSVPTFDVDATKFGVEICLDHVFGSLSDRLPSAAKPKVCVLMSAKVKLDTSRLPGPGTMVVHACSDESWSLVGLDGVTGASAKLEKTDPAFWVYSFTV
jgi:hypothetical protein